MALRDPAEAQTISTTEVEVPPIARTGNTEKKVEEKETREALLLVSEGCILAVHP